MMTPSGQGVEVTPTELLSGRDGVHDEQGVRVDRVAAAGADLEVELGADHVAGGADGTGGLIHQ